MLKKVILSSRLENTPLFLEKFKFWAQISGGVIPYHSALEKNLVQSQVPEKRLPEHQRSYPRGLKSP